LPTFAAEVVPIKHAILLGITIFAPSAVWGYAKLKHAAYPIHLLAPHNMACKYVNVQHYPLRKQK
jgi:hypothetical protein